MSDNGGKEENRGEQNFLTDELGLSNREVENIAQMHRELRNLRFANPGEANTFVTEETFSSKHGIRRSTRHRKVVTASDRLTEYIPHHDDEGYLIKADGHRVKLCDCLRISCAGCHYPCDKCGSRLCGPACQKNRDYIIESFFTDSEQPRIRRHPYYDPMKQREN